MNSSLLFFGQLLLATAALASLLVNLVRFGLRDSVTFLALLCWASLAGIFSADSLTFLGAPPTLYYGNIYGVLLGVLAGAWWPFVWLGVLESPTQLQRKVMWRIPLFCGLAGHALGAEWTLLLFAASWLGAWATLFYARRTHVVLVRLIPWQLAFSFACWIFLKADILLAAQLSLVLWVLVTQKMVNALLVKNLLRAAHLPRQ